MEILGIKILFVFDLIGTAAFAISGAFRGIKSNVDLSGVLMAGLLTAVGGGTLRDVFIFNEKIFWIEQPIYVYVALICALLTFLRPLYFSKKLHFYRFLDAVGLGVFTVIGVQKGLDHHFPAIVCVFCGLLPAIGGSLLRGIMLGETPPYVLRAGFYTTSAFIGTLFYLLFVKLQLSTEINLIIGAIFTIFVRMYSAAQKWELPIKKL